MASKIQNYKKTWQKKDPLYILNIRLHDGVSADKLWDRALDRVDRLFDEHFPEAKPNEDSTVLELGSGVGWIMEAVMDRFNVNRMIGLDISPNCIKQAKKRWSHERVEYQLYDGLSIPFEDDYVDNIYSVSCIQHIEKHCAYIILGELFRILKPGGHMTLHFLSMGFMSHMKRDYKEMCMDHINGTDKHMLYFYTKEELEILFGNVIGVKNLVVTEKDAGLYVGFSK